MKGQHFYKHGLLRRSNRMLTAFGRTQTLQQWADESGLHRCTIQRRLKLGWPVERAVAQVPRPIRYS